MADPSDTAIAAAAGAFRHQGGVMRTSEARAAGIHYRTLYWMRDHGLLEPLSRGVYHLTSEQLPPKPDVAAVMRRAPRAVLCLVSALDFHEIGTQVPSAVQIALPNDVSPPRIAVPRIEVFHMTGSAMSEGVEEHALPGAAVRVFSIPKTVADCFKFRGRIGQSVAVEALQDALRSGKTSAAEIMRLGKVDRVDAVMRPYLEALL